MKRNNRILNQTSDPKPYINEYFVGSTQKAKMWVEEDSQQGGCGGGGDVDELLAVLGYNVRSSDMAEVAQKLEQLEEAMATGNQLEDGEGRLSQIASETVHYNPSDLSTWLETMLTELNPPPNLDSPPQPLDASASASFFNPPDSIKIESCDPPYAPQEHVAKRVIAEEPAFSDYDLKAIPGKSICSQSASGNSVNKRPKLEQNPGGANVVSTESTRPLVLVDSQENGVRLVHTLMACAEAVQQNNLTLAEALVRQIGFLAVSQPGGAMRKVATYFAEALARRIYGVFPQNPLDNSLKEVLHMHFYEACPYLKFAHFTANQAILEAFEGKSQVHVIDFSMNQGMQWPALMQALAVRPGGPPVFRLTGIGPPAHDNSDQLQEVGWRLARFAETMNVKFEYRGFVAESLADLDSSRLNLRPDEESVAVNSVFELHRLLGRSGGIEKVLSVVKQLKPVIFTVVEQESNHNSPVFLDRFTESLHYYSTMFDSLEGSVNGDDKAMAEVYLGKQICNVVACEGVDRVERHETATQWRTRLGSAGFVPVHLGSNAFKQASMLLALFGGGDGYRVEENNGCLTLGWHTRPLIATSAWQLANRAGLTHRVNSTSR